MRSDLNEILSQVARIPFQIIYNNNDQAMGHGDNGSCSIHCTPRVDQGGREIPWKASTIPVFIVPNDFA